MKNFWIILGMVLYLLPGSMLAQSCYQQLDDASGMPNSNYLTSLEKEACELRNTFTDTEFQNNFKTYGFGYYLHVNTYGKSVYSYEQIMSDLLASPKINTTFYLVLSKRSDSEGIYTQYEVAVNLPFTGPFADLDATLRNAVLGKVQQAVDDKQEELDNNPRSYHLVEIAAMEALADCIDKIQKGEFLFSEEMLILDGFELIADEVDTRRTGIQSTAAPIFNYCGTEYYDEHVMDYVPVSGIQDIGAIGLIGDSIGLLTNILYTDNENYFSTGNEFSLARTVFGQGGVHFKVWVHYFNEDPGNTRVYAKYQISINRQHADKIITYARSKVLLGGNPAALDDPRGGSSRSMDNNCDTGDVSNLVKNWTAKECLLPDLTNSDTPFLGGVGSGIIDGILGDFRLITWVYDEFSIWDFSVGSFVMNGSRLLRKLSQGAMAIYDDLDWSNVTTLAYDKIKDSLAKGKELGNTLYQFWKNFNGELFLEKLICDVQNWFGNFDGQELVALAGYGVGFLVYEILKGFLTAGIINAVNYSKNGYKALNAISPNSISNIMNDARSWLNKLVSSNPSFTRLKKVEVKCSILGKGCFVAGTPVMMAAMPILTVPIQGVQLLDYVVAHKTVNTEYGLTASLDDETNTSLFDKDPYTSKQQRERDQYELDEENWNEVVFEEVYGNSTAKLALHNDWINQKNYQVDAIVNMNLPEQGITGLFRITSIKHILPQKKPRDEEESNDYDYKPVTALFIHQSDQVYQLTFDNGEILGVTYNHPIYSLNFGGWRLAGELEVGEEVLAKSGMAIIKKSEKKEGSEIVYNFEVKDLHNFLVGESGVIVHNTCWKATNDFLDKFKIGKKFHYEPPKRKSVLGPEADDLKDKNSHYKNNKRDKDGNIEVCYDDLGFPDFNDWVPISPDGKKYEFEIDMKGNHSTGPSGDYGQAFTQMENLLGYRPSKLSAINIPGYEGITWTLHHHQDGNTMQLIPRLLNSKVKHVGGAAIAEKGGQKILPGPNEIGKYMTNCK